MSIAQDIVSRYSSLKTLPHVAIRLTKLMSDMNTPIQEFEKVIKMDPVLVLRLMKVVNSPYYGLRQKAENISRIVVLLGMKNLRNMVVTTALKEIFATDAANSEAFSRPLLWLHSAAVAICSQMISERIFNKKGEDAFLCGILHDIGMIVENQVAQDVFDQAIKHYTPPNGKPFVEYENESLGTNHSQIGSLLAKDWKMPEEIQDGIRLHHNVKTELDPGSISAIVQLADCIVYKLNYTGIQGMTSPLSEGLAAFFRENINEFKVLVKDLPGEISKAKDIYATQED